MRKKLNDIKIVNKRVETISLPESFPSNIRRAISNSSHDTFENIDRRNLLKVLATSGGILLAGSFLNKFNKFKEMGLVSSPSTFFNNMNNFNTDSIKGEGLDGDLVQFFENFKIVKNDKEYVLYNKEGDNILIIDRDM